MKDLDREPELLILLLLLRKMFLPLTKEGLCMNREEFKKELEERLLNFAVAMVKMSTVRRSRRLLLAQLPRNTAGFEIGKR